MTAPLSVVVRDLVVDYEIYQDRRRALRDRLVSGKGSGRKVVRALHGVSFEVHEGESVGVIGSNGSGKSTMLSALAGLLPITSGEILVSDEPKLLGVGAALLPMSSGYRNIRLGLLALGLTSDEIESRLPEVAEFTELGDALERPLSTYSSGMRARLHFAIATARTPRILLIDEALAVGDKWFRAKSAERIDRVLAEAGTLLLVSHNGAEIRKQCERAIWIERGHLRDDGPVDRVLDRYDAAASA